MTTTHKRTAKTKGVEQPSSTPKVGIVVRRGARRRFEKLSQSAASLPVEIAWDRRTEARPAGPAGTERRQPPPFTWETADFVVVDRPLNPEPTVKKKTARATTASSKPTGKAARTTSRPGASRTATSRKGASRPAANRSVTARPGTSRSARPRSKKAVSTSRTRVVGARATKAKSR